MRNKILYRVLSALAALFCLCSCGLEEPFGVDKNNPEGYIEFVARPTGYNNQIVGTKSTPSEFERKVENCFFLLFDNNPESATYGDVIQRTNILYSLDTQRIETKGLSQVIACYLVNVSPDFVEEIVGYYKPDDASANPNHYLNSAVIDLSYPSTTNNVAVGTPYIDHDDKESTTSVYCIPMFGMWEGNISNQTAITIPVKSLLAKITLQISVDLDDLGTLSHLRDSYFNLQSYKVNNLPKQVSLIAPSAGNDSPWTSVDETAIETYFADFVVTLNNQKIYNDDSTFSPKTYGCEFYVPEYFLQPLSEEQYYDLPDIVEGSYGNQMYKPLAYASSKHPVFVTLTGVYDMGLLENNISIAYDIFLGEDAATDFTLIRNTNYINQIKITGFDNSDIDHRVDVKDGSSMTEIHGQVANCYIISTPGDYSILAYKGAHKYSDLKNIDPKYICTKGTSVKVKYNDALLLNLKSSDFTVGDANEDGILEISFTSPSILTFQAAGNVVIDLVYTEGGTEYTEWSWHLWFVPNVGIGSYDFVELGSHIMPDSNNSNMMDRNIGVTALTSTSTSVGAYFKYGEKEPYFDASANKAVSEGNTTAYKPYGGGSIKDYTPTWDTDAKSVTDPCPPGYRVPSSSVWNLDNGTGNNTSFSYNNISYPYSGKILASGGYENTNSIPQGDLYTAPSNIQFNMPSKGGYCLDVADIVKSKEINNISYSWEIQAKVGYLLTRDQILEYYYSAPTSGSGDIWDALLGGFQILSYRYREGKAKTEWKWGLLSGYYYTGEVDWGGWSTNDNKTTIPLQTEYNTLRGLIEKELEAKEANKSHSDLGAIPINKDNSYQVRCVKE